MNSPQAVRDWMTIWESELAARACDRDTREVILGALARWFEAGRTMAALPSRASDGAAGSAGADAAAGAAAAVAASGARDAALDELRSRVAELERRLAMDPGHCT